jgi:hypothetical protein
MVSASDYINNIPVDIEEHPLFMEIVRVASEASIDLNDLAQLSEVLNRVDVDRKADIRLVVIVSMILAHIMRNEEKLKIADIMSAVDMSYPGDAVTDQDGED